MMDGASIPQIVQATGIVGIIFIIWYYDSKRLSGYQKMLGDYRQLTKALHGVITQNTQILTSVQISTVSTQERYLKVAEDFKDIVISNTEAMTSLKKCIDDIREMTLVNSKVMSSLEEHLSKG